MFKVNRSRGRTPSEYHTKLWRAAEAPQALPWICCVEGAGVCRECFQPQRCRESPQHTRPVTRCSYMPESEENRSENGVARWVHGWSFCSNTLNVRKRTASGRHSSVCPAVLSTFTKEIPFFLKDVFSKMCLKYNLVHNQLSSWSTRCTKYTTATCG